VTNPFGEVSKDESKNASLIGSPGTATGENKCKIGF
jgi:hypothetical protein